MESSESLDSRVTNIPCPEHSLVNIISSGVELTGYLQDKDLTMRKVLFLPAQGRLISLSINMAGPGSVLHFWEIEDSKVEKVTTFSNSIIFTNYISDKNDCPGHDRLGGDQPHH